MEVVGVDLTGDGVSEIKGPVIRTLAEAVHMFVCFLPAGTGDLKPTPIKPPSLQRLVQLPILMDDRLPLVIPTDKLMNGLSVTGELRGILENLSQPFG